MTYEELKAELSAIAELVKVYPGPVQLKAFEILADRLLERESSSGELPKSKTSSLASGTPRTSAPKDKASRKSFAKESYSIDRNLNLRGDKSIPAFKAFVDEKKPDSAKEFNAVAVYYLTKLAGLAAATLDHAYTCYNEVKRKPPEHFRQSFIDTKNKEGWVEFDADGNLKMPHRGVVFVEHDLPRAPTKAKKSE